MAECFPTKPITYSKSFGGSRTYILENGTTQGSMLSPVLIAVMNDDLLQGATPQHGLFADDIAIWSEGLSIPDLLETVQKTPL